MLAERWYWNIYGLCILSWMAPAIHQISYQLAQFFIEVALLYNASRIYNFQAADAVLLHL